MSDTGIRAAVRHQSQYLALALTGCGEGIVAVVCIARSAQRGSSCPPRWNGKALPSGPRQIRYREERSLLGGILRHHTHQTALSHTDIRSSGRCGRHLRGIYCLRRPQYPLPAYTSQSCTGSAGATVSQSPGNVQISDSPLLPCGSVSVTSAPSDPKPVCGVTEMVWARP